MYEFSNRRTFAIISHPDAGKTTLTEKLLLYGGAIQMAGTIRARKAKRHATSDWMELEKERGISVTASVLQFPYRDCVINLLDTPGHADFSEDTYRTLSAVDSALMVIDAAKGVEERTIKLMEVCRMRATPIITFVNKLDREVREPLDLLDEIEKILGMRCAALTWPIGMGKSFRGVYDLITDKIRLFERAEGEKAGAGELLGGLDDPRVGDFLDAGQVARIREELDLIRNASPRFDRDAYLAGRQTPVYFGAAINNFGVRELLDALVDYAPEPQSRAARQRLVVPREPELTGFVFKIQANMNPAHRDRIAFLRICSGNYRPGMKLHQVRSGRSVTVSNAVTFLAEARQRADSATAGDIIGLYNHGTLRVGDSFTEGESLDFIGVPDFAPELFRRAHLENPLRSKALLKGLQQLAEEGATQLYRPLVGQEMILGAVGILQFEVAAYRLRDEYGVECRFEPVGVAAARWVRCEDPRLLEDFRRKAVAHLALDGAGELAYIAPTKVNLALTIERWPGIEFAATREHLS